MIENKMMPQLLHHLYRHITYLILSTFVFSKYHQPTSDTKPSRFETWSCTPFDGVSQHRNFWTTTPQNDRHVSRFKRTGLDTFHPKNVQRVCENLGWTSSPKKTVDVLPPVQGFCGFAAKRTALAVKNGSSQGLDREMRTNLCRGIRENLREKSKVDSAGCFWFLTDFPVEFIHLWRKFLGCST